MSNCTSIEAGRPHVVFFPSPGMGHLTPFLRLAAMVASRDCTVTLVSTQPMVSAEESAQISSFFSGHPDITRLEFQILDGNTSSSPDDDAFITQFKAMNRSVHLLPPLLSSLPHPVSALFSDFVVAATLAPITADLGIPNYIVSTTSARCYSTVAYLPVLLSNASKFEDDFGEIQIPGLAPLPKSIVPPSWLDDSPSNHLLTDYLIPNAQSLPKVDGVLLNSFNWFEQETIAALLDGRALSTLPPLYPIGPLEPDHKLERVHGVPWLDDQTAESVVYVNFGSRTVLSEDQLRELGKGLERSAFPFMWVLRENEDGKELREVLGDSFLERTKNMGMVMKGWVNQAAILAHPALGGFVNQCEWDSVTEAARAGVPMLAWPQHGDHKMNAEVVEEAGLGMWVKDWGWAGERLVNGEEIEERVRELMGDEILRDKAKKAGKEGKGALEVGGSSENALMGVIEVLKKKARK